MSSYLQSKFHAGNLCCQHRNPAPVLHCANASRRRAQPAAFSIFKGKEGFSPQAPINLLFLSVFVGFLPQRRRTAACEREKAISEHQYFIYSWPKSYFIPLLKTLLSLVIYKAYFPPRTIHDTLIHSRSQTKFAKIALHPSSHTPAASTGCALTAAN